MNAFIQREPTQAIGALYRNFSFIENCVYGAIQSGSDQISVIDDLNLEFGKVVYYLLYNPHMMPLSISYPLPERIRLDHAPGGCRVFDADQVHQVLTRLTKGESPTFEMLTRTDAASNWPLETWAADLLLTCHVGQQFDDSQDVRRLILRRSGPIGVALAVSITLQDG
jgi:hypothetical protein